MTTLKTGWKCYSTKGKGETDLDEERYLVSVVALPPWVMNGDLLTFQTFPPFNNMTSRPPPHLSQFSFWELLEGPKDPIFPYAEFGL